MQGLQDGDIEALQKHILAAPLSASDLGRWLWVAAGYAQPSAVELLIRYRADVHYTAEGGRSAILSIVGDLFLKNLSNKLIFRCHQ